MHNQDAYDMGYDCGTNSPNLTNGHSTMFSTPENTAASERDKEAATTQLLWPTLKPVAMFEVMPQLVVPSPQYRGLSEAEVLAALADHSPGNPVAHEVARLVAGYTENFRAHVERLGRIPEDILHVSPETGIEAVAMRLTTQTIQDAIEKEQSNRTKGGR